MPQIVPALAAVGTAFSTSAVGTFLTTTAIGKFLATTAISMAVNALAVALAPDQQMRSGGISTDVTTSGANHARSFILGTYATAGHGIMPPLNYDIDKDDRKYLTYIIDLADTRISGVESVIIDGQAQKLQAQVLPGHPAYHFDDELGARPEGDLSGVAFFKFHNGSQTAVDPMLLAKFEQYPDRPITSDFKFTGVAYAICSFKYRIKDPRYSGLPEVKFVVHGKPLYDIRKDSTAGGSGTHRWGHENTYEFSANPVVMIYNLMRGIQIAPGHIYGVGVPASQLPINQWAAAMNACDEAGTETGTDWQKDIKRYRAGIEIKCDEEPLDAINELLKSCGGVMAPVGDSYLVSVGSPAIPVAHFTDADLILSSPASFTMSSGLAGSFNAVTANYPSPSHLWEENNAEPLFNAAWEVEDDNRRLIADVKFGAVPYPRQVRRLMREMAADNRRQRQHSLVLSPMYLAIQPTETISWTSETNGYNSKLFEVISKQVDSETLTVGLVIRERDPSDYDFDVVSDSRVPYVPPAGNTIPTLVGVAGFSVQAVILKDADGKDRRVAIKLLWSDEATYSGVSYEVRLAGSTDVALAGSASDIARGHAIIADGVLPNTAYQVRARSLKGSRPGEWTGWLPVTTANVRQGLEDVSQDVLDTLDELTEWIGNDGTAIFEDLDALRNQINNDVGTITDNVTQVRTDLEADVLAARNLAIDNLAVAKSYTDTSIVSEQQARQSSTDAMSARIDQLTAALTSENLVSNPNFLEGAGNDAADWVEVGTVSRIAKDTGSADTLIASMPQLWTVQLNSGNVNAVKQTVSLDDYAATDKLQFKCKAGALGTTARTISVKVRWFNASSVEITPASAQTISINAGGIWRAGSGRFDIPAGAATAEIEFRHSSASGSRILLTEVAISLVNTEIEARLSELEVAQANTTSAMATMSSTIDARFGANEAAINLESTTRANNDAAVSLRIDGVESRTANAEAKIITIETTIANTNASIVAVEDRISAKYGVAELVRDPIFQDGIARWNHSGTLSNSSFGTKNIADASWPISDCPAPSFLRINAGATGFITSQRFPVAAGEVFDVGFGYARVSNGVIPRFQYIFRNKSGTAVAAPNPQNGQIIVGNGAGIWRTASHLAVTAPTGAVTVELQVGVSNAAGPNACWVTNISFRRRQPFETQAAAEIETVKLASANNSASIVTLTDAISTNYTTLDGKITTNADNISLRYTKSETDGAISAAINTYDSTLTTKFGAKADSSVVVALTSRVANTEGQLVSQSGSIQTLNDSVELVTTTANGKGKVIYSSTAPVAADRLTQNLWIDTSSGNNTPKRWNGTAWVAMSDKAATDALQGLTTKAESSAVTALTSRVSTAEGTLTSQGNSLTSLNNSVGRMNAGGRFRMTTQATPTGAQARIGLHAEASDGQNTHSAGLFLVARTDGTSDIIAAAKRFSIATSDGANDARVVPFIVTGGVVRMRGAVIQDLTIGRGKVGEGAITGWQYAYAAKALASKTTSDVVIAQITFKKNRSVPMPIWFSATYPGGAILYLQRRIGTGAWTTIMTINDTAIKQADGSYSSFNNRQSGRDHSIIDKWTGTGSVSYRVTGRTFGIVSVNYGGGGSEASWDHYPARAAHNFTNRFLGAFVAYK